MGTGSPVPGKVSSPAVWRPGDFADASEWAVTLSTAERDEIITIAPAAVTGSG